ncbi:hypothetical protein CTEN210_00848 [Chaetoceros tenuissimus]|uniref:Leucine-rich repeat domain-containing protein n=1 Tax=Chaetoceros tenuissimus TaxID=426638 RepID=A0AAD3GZI9_9STRA|nr:hypothetical protein CTEN210_00848 [Chaetoceros tenuissimus]
MTEQTDESLIQMFEGKKTYFYNGEKLWEGEYRMHDWNVDRDASEFLIHDKEERASWEMIVVMPEVEIIPEWTFIGCINVEMIIMCDDVKRIEFRAFMGCSSLSYVCLSTSLEYIGRDAFFGCDFLTSVFVPPSCRHVDDAAFYKCEMLEILHVPQDTHLGMAVIGDTELLGEVSPFDDYKCGNYKCANDRITNDVNEWIKNINGREEEEFALHRACSSFNLLEDIVYGIVKRQGISSMKKENSIGITPSQYLKKNPYAELEERKIMNRYILDMMGENVM